MNLLQDLENSERVSEKPLQNQTASADDRKCKRSIPKEKRVHYASAAAKARFQKTRDKERCASCLVSLGYGIRKIKRMLLVAHGTAARWGRKYKVKSEAKTEARTLHARRNYDNQTNKSNAQKRIAQALRQRMRDTLFVKRESDKFSTLIGCTGRELMIHIGSQFKHGMTWFNYGEWHIDHIKPCASFDLTVRDNALMCFHYSNLQPLWAKENLSKGAKIAGSLLRL